MENSIDSETRFFIDLDMATREVVHCGFGDRRELSKARIEPSHHRVYVSQGQFNKLQRKLTEGDARLPAS